MKVHCKLLFEVRHFSQSFLLQIEHVSRSQELFAQYIFCSKLNNVDVNHNNWPLECRHI
jgi:hypothetical protein